MLEDEARLEQLNMLRANATRFADRNSPPCRARALRGVPPGFDRQFWQSIASQGWTGLLVPEVYGGHGLGFAEMAEVVSSLSVQVAPEPVTPVLVFAGRLLEACAENAIAHSLLGEMAHGHSLPAVAWQEDTTGVSGFDANGHLATPATSCQVDSGRLRLSGCKRHVRPGAAADGYVVTAQLTERLALVWVPSASVGLTCESELLADGSFAAKLVFAQVDLPFGNVLATDEAAQSALAAAYDATLVIAGVELLALLRQMLTMSLDYLRTRTQFGKAIGSFQSLQHRAVDLLIQQELCSAVIAQAIAATDAGCDAKERALLAARVKARCSDAALCAAREAVQFHGAIGFTDEYDLGLYLQRALVLAAWLGNGSIQRWRFSALGGHLRSTGALE